MRLLVAVVKNGMATFYSGPEPKTEKQRLDEEAQFLELKLTFKPLNLNIGGNLEYWKKLVEEKKWYGLFVLIDHDKKCVEYLPLKTKNDFKEFTTEEKKE
jgi:hypothetical protein